MAYGPFPHPFRSHDVTFRLDLPIGWRARLHPVFHASSYFLSANQASRTSTGPVERDELRIEF